MFALMRIFVNIFRNYLYNKLDNKKTTEVSYMAVEEQLEQAKKAVERQIKMALIQKSMTQAELAELIGESRQDINKAVKGGTSPKDLMIRKKIYKVLGME